MDVKVLRNEALEVQIDPSTLQFSVTHRSSGLRWAFEQNADADLRVVHGRTETLAYLKDARESQVCHFSTPTEERLTFLLKALPGGVGLSISFALPLKEDFLRVEVEPLPTTSPSHVEEVWYPGPAVPVHDDVQYTVWPHGAGTMIPAHHDQEIKAGTRIYVGSEVTRRSYALAFTRPLYEPWWGVVGEKAAYLAIAETPFDFGLELEHPRGGPTFVRPLWVPSLGRLSYPRAIRYYFMEGANHVTLAKTYRRYAQSIGRWMPLSEKLERNPVARRLIGGMICPVSICRHNVQRQPKEHQVVSFAERTAQLRRLRELGRDRVYLHIDGWGTRGYDNHHPDIFPPCPEAGGWQGLIDFSKAAQECGYLFGLHDQYRDFYLDGPSFLELRAIKTIDGSLPQWSRWAGGPQTLLCAKEALPFLRHNFTQLLSRGVHLTASYLDVLAIVPLDECYDARHPMTREDCFHWRAKALDYVRSLGVAISSEEPVDCFIPHLDFAHWADYPREEFMIGDYLGIPVPLHTLVYHDALLLPATFDYARSREMRAWHFLEGLSQVEIPYGKIDWDSREHFEKVDLLAQLHGAWATHELLDHRLLDADGMIQEFEYPEGKISIDLKDLRYQIEGGPVATDGWVAVDV